MLMGSAGICVSREISMGITPRFNHLSRTISEIYILIKQTEIHKGFPMSDNYALKRYHRQTVPVMGTNRKKKVLLVFMLLFLAGAVGIVYLVYSSGILAEDNPKIVSQLARRINLERHANNLPVVSMDSSLSNLAYVKSKEVKISQLNYARGSNPNLDENTNVFIIPKITWALSGSDFRQQMVDSLENENSGFRKNVLNPRYRSIGIGMTSDSYNYFIVTQWKET
jgi:uncharacterized protein YkwD